MGMREGESKETEHVNHILIFFVLEEHVNYILIFFVQENPDNWNKGEIMVGFVNIQK